MAQSIKSNLVLAGSGILLGVVVLFYFNSYVSHSDKAGATTSIIPGKISEAIVVPDLSHISLPKAEPIAQVATEFEALKLDLIDKIRQQYSSTIENIAVQVSLKAFLVDLIKQYPERGRALFEAVILAAFPDIADDIFQAVNTMAIYDEWLLDNVLALNDMPPLEYNGELWKKRRELFGDDANRIWSSEITAQEERRKALHKTVAMLDQAYDTTMNERVYILQSAYEEQYSETVENVVFDSNGVLAQVLFGFDSVQKELAAMSNEERQTQIDTVRRTIGFDEQQIEYYAEQDQIKDKRWLNGYSYMEARQSLFDSLSGEELELELNALREEHFKHEAPTISREERDDYFRFKRPRVYGRN